MVQFSAQPVYQLLGYLLLAAPTLVFVAMLANSLSSQLTARALQKIATAHATRSRYASASRYRAR